MRRPWLEVLLLLLPVVCLAQEASRLQGHRKLSCTDQSFGYAELVVDEVQNSYRFSIRSLWGLPDDARRVEFTLPLAACRFREGEPENFDCRVETEIGVTLDGKVRKVSSLFVQLVRHTLQTVDATTQTLELHLAFSGRSSTMSIPGQGCFRGPFPASHPSLTK